LCVACSSITLGGHDCGYIRMDLPTKVFDFLKSFHALQDVHVSKRKKNGVSLTAEASRAISSGHVPFFAVTNILQQRGVDAQQTVAGTPGDAVASDVTHYNWSVVCELLQKLNVPLSPDHRMLLGCADPGIIVDLLKTMETRFGPTGGTRGAKSPSPTRNRTEKSSRAGAVSVDQGKDRLSKQRRESGQDERFDVFKDLERIKKKREEKLVKKQEEAERLVQVEQRVKAQREKSNPVNDNRKGLLEDVVSSAPLPCYLQFSNRGNAQFCHQMIMDMVQRVVQGEAQEQIRMRELERKKGKELAAKRKTEGDRFVSHGIVTVPRDADHRAVVLCRALVYEMVTYATLPETKLLLAKRDRERTLATDRATDVKKKITQLHSMRPPGRKFEDKKKTFEEQEQREREERDRRYVEMRKENEERARTDLEAQQRIRQEKELAAQQKEEEKKRKDAERMLYYAEQKAKVLEARRANAVEDEMRRAKEAETERVLREERRQRTVEISKKLMERELKREAAMQAHGSAPTSLSPFSAGTGQRSGYTGSSLGWQFLTDDERVVAELVQDVRSDPEQGIGIVESRMSNTKGNIVWFTDQGGRRHPLTLAEGPEAHDSAVELLRKCSRRTNASLTSAGGVHVNMSIALTLAARCHAADLAFHGIADPSVWHIGTDGASATQRVGKFGTGLGGPGTTQEVVVSVVRPTNLRLSAADILGFTLVDDGCPTRENREALLKSVAASSGAGTECCGVGHALATCGEDTTVEVFVVLFTAGTYTDKPVAQMAASQFNLLSSCAAPFLEGQRHVSKGVARTKKDLYKVVNITIGRKTEGLRQGRLEALAGKRAVPQKRFDEDEAEVPLLRKKSSRRRSTTSMEEADGQSELQRNDDVDADDSAVAEESQKQSQSRRRLSSFFQRYAPEKMAVIDTALTLNEGREDQMFQKLAQAYGPEPTPDNSPSELSRSNSRGGSAHSDVHQVPASTSAPKVPAQGSSRGGSAHSDLEPVATADATGPKSSTDEATTVPLPTHDDGAASVSLPFSSGDPLQSFTLRSAGE
jgi:hypothetical protein